MGSNYAGLPADLSPPYAAAARIVNLETSAARERLLATVPEQWRVMVAHFARVGLATLVVSTKSLEERQRRLAEVPQAWRVDVEAHVRRLWPRRDELRSESWRPGRRPTGDGE
jgi:hypothetical protein